MIIYIYIHTYIYIYILYIYIYIYLYIYLIIYFKSIIILFTLRQISNHLLICFLLGFESNYCWWYIKFVQSIIYRGLHTHQLQICDCYFMIEDRLDSDETANFRTISNVSPISKIPEGFVAKRLNVHLEEIGMIPIVQSVYLHHHLTETALTIVVSHILMVNDAGDNPGLVLLDLSASFDTVDHSILLQRLHTRHHIGGISMNWLTNY